MRIDLILVGRAGATVDVWPLGEVHRAPATPVGVAEASSRIVAARTGDA